MFTRFVFVFVFALLLLLAESVPLQFVRQVGGERERGVRGRSRRAEHALRCALHQAGHAPELGALQRAYAAQAASGLLPAGASPALPVRTYHEAGPLTSLVKKKGGGSSLGSSARLSTDADEGSPRFLQHAADEDDEDEDEE